MANIKVIRTKPINSVRCVSCEKIITNKEEAIRIERQDNVSSGQFHPYCFKAWASKVLIDEL